MSGDTAAKNRRISRCTTRETTAAPAQMSRRNPRWNDAHDRLRGAAKREGQKGASASSPTRVSHKQSHTTDAPAHARRACLLPTCPIRLETRPARLEMRRPPSRGSMPFCSSVRSVCSVGDSLNSASQRPWKNHGLPSEYTEESERESFITVFSIRRRSPWRTR